MSQQIVADTVQKLLAEMAQMREELNRLKNQSSVTGPAGVSEVRKPGSNPSRRRLLRKLAGGLLAATTLGIVGATTPAEAKFVRNGGAGAVVMPANGTLTGSLPANTMYGLIGTSDTSLDLSGFSDFYKAGVLGIIGGSSIQNFGVFGNGGSAGVYGSGSNYGVQGKGFRGVYGETTSSVGSGVYGNGGGVGVGVIGSNAKSGGLFIGSKSGVELITGGGSSSFDLPANTSVGLIANAGFGLDLSTFGDNQNIGLYAIAGTAGGRTATAGVFSGNVAVYGALSKGGGSFKIDHPLDPESKYLYHSFVESPDMKNIYDGVVTLDEQGQALVELPGWFEALNSDFRYQLTPLGAAATGLYISQEVQNGRFKIAGGSSGQRVSWQVTGIRQDAWAKANRIPVEEDKSEAERGYYLHPEVFGYSPEKNVDGALRSLALKS